MIAKILDRYFNKNIELRAQVYHLLGFMGIFAGFTAVFVNLFLDSGMIITILDLAVSAISYIMLRVAYRKKCYRLCSWIWIGTVFMVAFPALFFFCGGHKSGTSCFFILAIAFTALLLEKREMAVAVAVEFLIYTACSLAAYYIPEIVVKLSPDFAYVLHSIMNFATCGSVMLASVLIRNRMIDNRQEQIEEQGRELEARNETLLKYDRMKSEFLATVAHEINNPLAVISASSSDTLDLLSESPPNIEEIRENQAVIERRVKKIDAILLDLMDSAAIENGRLSLDRKPVDLGELLKSICDARFGIVDENGNKIVYEIEEDLPKVWADPPRIEQVMANLLSNAAKHTNGGVITVGLKKAEKGQVVCVSDTGEGMEEEMKRVIFKHYVSTKSDYWRHGIGLHVCRQIIAAHGGEIWVESEKGGGTSIYFTLKEEED